MAKHVVNGTAASETLNGGFGDDEIHGNDGNDVMVGSSGANEYFGGAGNDIVRVVTRDTANPNDDLVHGFVQGSDKIDVSAWGISDFSQIQAIDGTCDGAATFDAYYNGYHHIMRIEGIKAINLTAADFTFAVGGPANQTGTAHDDVLFGSAGNNTLNGGAGCDVLLGGAGDDTLIGGLGADAFDGGAGTDTLSYNYDDIQRVKIELAKGTVTFANKSVEHFKGIENAIGSKLGDGLIGDDNNNVLKGAGGDDRLHGGKGADTLVGGAGADRFTYFALTDSPTAGRDKITDFGTGDRIDLAQLEDATHQTFHFIGGAAFSHAAGELQVVASGSNTAVNVDVDGNGAAEFSILLTGSHTLTVSDFIL